MKKCEKCGNKFKKEDFSKLKFKQELSGHFTDELDLFNELTICPDCFFTETKDDPLKKQVKLSKK